MSTLNSNIRLRPTTITITQPTNPSSHVLRLSFTPHLVIHSNSINSITPLKKDTDAIFEVMVPTGGCIDLKIGIEEDALHKVGGNEMSISEELEMEDEIRKTIIRALKRNAAVLAIQEIELTRNNTYTLRPLASSADRSTAQSALVSSYQPVAHLTGIGISLNWCSPSTPREKRDSDESQASNTTTSSFDPGLDGAELDKAEGLDRPSEAPTGTIPEWANGQIELALGELFRVNLIKRFPLIFDPDLHRYIPAIVNSSMLLDSLTRALSLSSVHRTDLLLAARPILRSLVAEQNRMIKFKAEQISNMGRRSKSAKRIKGDTTSGVQDDTENCNTSESRQPPCSETEESMNKVNVKLLSDAITRMGWIQWKQKRARSGKMGHRRIEIITEDTDSKSSKCFNQNTDSQEMNQRMSGLHLADNRFGNTHDDDGEVDIDSDMVYQNHLREANVSDEDEMFLASDGNDDYEDDDYFLRDDTDEEDTYADFLDSESEEGGREEGRTHAQGDSGYPWPYQINSPEDEDYWLNDEDYDAVHNEVDDDFLDSDIDRTYDEDQAARCDPSQHFLSQLGEPLDDELLSDELFDDEVWIGEQTSNDYWHEDGHTESDHLGNTFRSQDEDQAPGHATSPIPHRHPLRGSDIQIQLRDEELLEDDAVDDETRPSPSVSRPDFTRPLAQASHPSIPQPLYIVPHPPQFSLGQAAEAMILDINLDAHFDHASELLESDEESELGEYTIDQYFYDLDDNDDASIPQSSYGGGRSVRSTSRCSELRFGQFLEDEGTEENGIAFRSPILAWQIPSQEGPSVNDDLMSDEEEDMEEIDLVCPNPIEATTGISGLNVHPASKLGISSQELDHNDLLDFDDDELMSDEEEEAIMADPAKSSIEPTNVAPHLSVPQGNQAEVTHHAGLFDLVDDDLMYDEEETWM